MGKYATTIDQQIELLRSRGMELDLEEDKIKEILLDIGYYRLGCYWNPFEMDENHNFEEGSKFSNVIRLYYLDHDLRNLLQKYMNRIEIHFRNQIVYEVSNHFKDSPTWFIDPKCVNKDIFENFKKGYRQVRRNNKFLSKHHVKYVNDKFAPAWKTLEFMSFGTILTIYKNLLDSNIQTTISKKYNIKKANKLINWLGVVLFIRNSCAHGAVIFDLNTPLEIVKLPQVQFHNDDRHSLDSSIKVIRYLLGVISENRANDFNKEMTEIIQRIADNAILANIVKTKMNFAFELNSNEITKN